MGELMQYIVYSNRSGAYYGPFVTELMAFKYMNDHQLQGTVAPLRPTTTIEGKRPW